MPRTIESILACYQAARSRRAQGLSSWAKHISLRQPAPQYVSYGDISREDLQNAAASHEEVLRREFSEILDITKVDIYDQGLDDLVDNLEWLGEGGAQPDRRRFREISRELRRRTV
jgi:hypothetical protein